MKEVKGKEWKEDVDCKVSGSEDWKSKNGDKLGKPIKTTPVCYKYNRY